MRTLLVAFLLAACPAFSADQDFNGRWDISTTSPRPRAWWFQLTGVGTPAAAGKFVSAYNGDMNNIDKIEVKNGELIFTIISPARPAGKKSEATPAERSSIMRASSQANWTAPSRPKAPARRP